MKDVLSDEYMRVAVDDLRRVVRIVRSSVPMPGIDRYEAFADQLQRLFPPRERARLRLLMDVRDSPLRNDPEFEARMQSISASMFGGWSRRAMLVRTAVGKLQMSRQSRMASNAYAVFDDEAAAIAFLTGPEG